MVPRMRGCHLVCLAGGGQTSGWAIAARSSLAAWAPNPTKTCDFTKFGFFIAFQSLVVSSRGTWFLNGISSARALKSG